ncbi:hypothetical protein ECEC1865_0956, partial [Escherichia coli EC1865]
LKRRK